MDYYFGIMSTDFTVLRLSRFCHLEEEFERKRRRNKKETLTHEFITIHFPLISEKRKVKDKVWQAPHDRDSQGSLNKKSPHE